MKFASAAEDALMLGVGRALDAKLTDLGKAAVREIVTAANRLGVPPDHLPYVFWALATKAGLPKLGQKESEALDMMVTVLDRTGTMPSYSSAFSVADDLGTDAAIDQLAKHMATWSLRTLYPGLLQGYKDALNSQVKAVPKATNGQVKDKDAFNFLRLAFRQIVNINSRMFRDGELLRRVVRLLPI